MIRNINETYINQKIDEYIYLLVNANLITNEQIYDIKNKLNSIKVERIYNAPGDAVTYANSLKICFENIEYKMNKNGEYYIDEVLFHEFTHFINSFHNSIYGDNRFFISEYIEQKMNNFTTIELLEQSDEYLINQDACFGIILLDEFIAQTITQKLILLKLYNLKDNEKNKYMPTSEIEKYKKRCFKTNICEPPMKLETTFATYEEFYPFTQKFLKKHKLNEDELIKNSLKQKNIKTFIDNFNQTEIEVLYRDLCYLGLVQQRVYYKNGFIDITDINDPAYDPNKMNKVMTKIIKW